jgi:cellulose 1,4-beta-cellobiosidase
MTYGSCCNEMDIWEANSAATAFTPHPCNITGTYACTGGLCGAGTYHDEGVCDEEGCDFNSYRMGNETFYGPNLIVDTTKPFTVVTQFITSDSTATGTLSQINRLYVQNGVVIQNSNVTIPGIIPVNDITDQYCTSQKTAFGSVDAFGDRGGMAVIGEALGRGMVLVFSIWEDSGSDMLWLDSTYPVNATSLGTARGPCAESSGNPADIIAQFPGAQVTFSNIKVGDLGSTFIAGV